jgi:hypothetical protein
MPDPIASPMDFKLHHYLISSNLAGRSLVRIVEEELIAVGIIDHQEPVAPGTLLDRNALGLEFGAQRVQRGDRGLARLWLDVQGNEHQPLANLLRPRVGQDKRAALPVDLCDMRSAVLVVAPGAREAEPVNVKRSEASTSVTCRTGRANQSVIGYISSNKDNVFLRSASKTRCHRSDFGQRFERLSAIFRQPC